MNLRMIIRTIITLLLFLNLIAVYTIGDNIINSLKDIKEQNISIHKHIELMNNDDISSNHSKEYQIQVESQGCLIWDNKRFVGFVSYNPRDYLSQVIIRDNQ